jgi:hypothetical protein
MREKITTRKEREKFEDQNRNLGRQQNKIRMA